MSKTSKKEVYKNSLKPEFFKGKTSKLIYFEEVKKIKFRFKYENEFLYYGNISMYIPKRLFNKYINKLKLSIKRNKIVYGKNKSLVQLIFKLANRNELEDLFYIYGQHKKYYRPVKLKEFCPFDSFYNSLTIGWEKYFVLERRSA